MSQDRSGTTIHIGDRPPIYIGHIASILIMYAFIGSAFYGVMALVTDVLRLLRG